MEKLTDIIAANRSGQRKGIYAVCSAQELVLEAALEQARDDASPTLIEATANQVNQFGGYTGMRPADFKDYVLDLAFTIGVPANRIILGGDHLGPVCWQNESAEQAMQKAHDLIEAYAKAGFKKIHLDCSMPCADDSIPLSDAIIAERAASLCVSAEQVATKIFGYSDINYVIGTEVPPPGGTNEAVTELEVTDITHAQHTLNTHKAAFKNKSLDAAWERVIGLVVQPGVEFSHETIVHYNRNKAEALSGLIVGAQNIVFEAHSTDYQLPNAYRELVQDHFAILKVGPQLTFALREALYGLSYIEDNLIAADKRSNLRSICEEQMLAQPEYWQKYYPGDEHAQRYYRHYSYSDRIRYYWPNHEIKAAIKTLFANLDAQPIPLPLISQFLPEQFLSVSRGSLNRSPRELVKAKIKQVTEAYAQACWKQ